MFPITTFRCPGCGEYINTEMKQCKYCSMFIDPQTANAAVELQEKINNACNDASNIRNLAGAMWIGFFVRFIPFFGLIGYVSFVLFFVVLVKLIIWQVRYGSIRTSDVDFKQANRNWIIALVLWGLMLIVPIVLIIFFAGLIAATSR
jgi:hypothetical protein